VPDEAGPLDVASEGENIARHYYMLSPWNRNVCLCRLARLIICSYCSCKPDLASIWCVSLVLLGSRRRCRLACALPRFDHRLAVSCSGWLPAGAVHPRPSACSGYGYAFAPDESVFASQAPRVESWWAMYLALGSSSIPTYLPYTTARQTAAIGLRRRVRFLAGTRLHFLGCGCGSLFSPRAAAAAAPLPLFARLPVLQLHP
jgi:hypothetical protein